MRVTSLVRSLVELPYVAKDGTLACTPSPGSVASSRVAVQTDHDASTCVAFVASGGGVWRHAVPFAGGEDVAEGKEAMLKPATVLDGVTTRVCAVRHRHEIQSIALYDPRTYHGSSRRRRERGGPDAARVGGSLGALRRGRTMRRDGVATQTPTQWFLNPAPEPRIRWEYRLDRRVFRSERTRVVVAVARRHAKTIDVFDGDRLVRSMRAPLAPSALCFVERDGTFSKTDSDSRTKKEISMLAVAEGNALSLWDARPPPSAAGACGESGRAVQPRAEPVRGGGRREKGRERRRRRRVPEAQAGGPVRGVRGRRAGRARDRRRPLERHLRWPGAMKFDITQLAVSRARPGPLLRRRPGLRAAVRVHHAGGAVRWRAGSRSGGTRGGSAWAPRAAGGAGTSSPAGARAGTSSAARVERAARQKTRKPERNAREANRV